MDKKVRKGQAGFTLLEVILVLVIAGILAALLVVGIGRIARQAYLGRVNDSAEVVYMAMQSAVTDLKAQGRFDEVFSDEFLGEPHHGVPANPDAKFYAVPDSVIDGTTTVPGVTGALGGALSAEEKNELKANRSIVYMVMNRDDDGAAHKDSELLKELLDPYISDKSIFNYSILVEVNRSNRTVRAAFFSERTPELKYAAATPDETLKRDKADVYYRDRDLLDEKSQGYYGTLAAGVGESISRLDHAFVNIHNDDMLTVEWGEFTPARANTWAEKKEILPDMTYDLYIVNAVDTTKVYYKIEGITPYEDGADYITYSASGGTNTVVSGTGNKFIGNTSYGTTRLPVYDLFAWSDVSHGINPDLTVSSFATFKRDAGTGSLAEMTPSMEHRLSYLPGTEMGANGTPGRFRLVLDSITEAGHDGLSVSKIYPELPWNENFKVIVEGKYQGEGFTGSMVVSGDVANAYTESKGLYSPGAGGVGNISTTTGRGVNTFLEFVNYIKDRLPNMTPQPDSHWWYEVSYARHLNNLRYIVSDNTTASGDYNRGKYQNFLVSRDIDWSLQQIGRGAMGAGGAVTHRVTVANTTSADLHTAGADTLKTFVPISTVPTPTGAPDVKDGYSGLIQSERFENDGRQKIGEVTIGAATLDVYEPHKIYGLKIAKDTGGEPGRVSPDLDAERVGLFETVSSDGEVSHLTLSGLAVLGGDDVGAFAGTFYGKGTELTVSSDEIVRDMKTAVQKADGTWSEADKGDVKPWDYAAASPWKGNHIKGKNRVGGLFGTVEKGTVLFAAADASGILKDLANGTAFADFVERSEAVASTLPPLNGVSVSAESWMAGGIAGYVNQEARMVKVANTGAVTAETYAGGIAGAVGKKVSLSGADPDAADGKYLVERHNVIAGTAVFNTAEYQNYGSVTAKKTGAVAEAGSYAGGIAGASGDKAWLTETAVISNMRNAGYILAENNYAGGIAGNIEKTEIYNVQNASDVQAWDSYAGGIVGSATEKSRIEGAQNLKPGGDGVVYTDVYYNANGAKVYRSKSAEALRSDALTPAPSGITAVRYAGGIAGMLDDDTKVNALAYNTGTQPVDQFAKALTSSAGADNPVIINRSKVKEEAFVPGETEQVMPLANYWQVTGTGTGPGGSADAGRYIGGIVGLIQGEAALNDYSNPISSAPGWTMRVAVKNRGNITSQYGSYVGGIAGAAAGSALICNPENGRVPGTAAGYEDIVIQAFEYTGGVAGAVDSEAELGTGTTGLNVDDKLVRILSSRIPVEVIVAGGAKESYDYRTNRALKVVSERGYAGGIAGYIDVNSPAPSVTNAFNGGDVQAEFKAGGLFGEAAGRTETGYDLAVLEKRLLRGTEEPYATNNGKITVSGDIAGGIAGAVSSPEVKLRDVFNSGEIEAGDSYAGGIVGYAVTENPGIAGTNGIIRNTDRALTKIILKAGGSTGQLPVYNNSGSVMARGSCAGGIIGKASVSLTDMFNAGEIKTGVAYAGGLVGKLEYNMGRDPAAGDPEGDDPQIDGTSVPAPGEAIILATTLKGTDPDTGAEFGVVTKMHTDAVAGAAKRDMLFHNRGNVATERDGYAGGIVGSAVRGETDISQPAIEVRDLYNAGHVVAGLTTAMNWTDFDDESLFGRDSYESTYYADDNISAGGIIGRAQGLILRYDKDSVAAVYRDEETLPRGNKLLPNMGGIYAGNEAGGLIGSAAGAGNGQDDVLIENGASRGIVRADRESAGGILGEGIRATIKTDAAVADTMIEIARDNSGDKDKLVFSNLGRVIAGTNNAGGIAGKLESGIVTNMFNQGEVRAGMDNAGGVVGYAVETKETISTVISHTKETAENMFAGAPDGKHIFTNTASVRAGGSNAGGIVGKAVGIVRNSGGYHSDLGSGEDNKKLGKVVLTDVYSGDPSTKGPSGVGGISPVEIEANYNAGGVAGRFVDAVLVNEHTAEIALDEKIYTNNAVVTARTSNAGGIIGNADARKETTGDIRQYYKEPEKMKVEVDSNHFLVEDVYNIGKVTAGDTDGGGYNAGGIFGIAGAGAYVNNPDLVKVALAEGTLADGTVTEGMRTNKGSITAGNNAGGVFGAVTAKFDTAKIPAAKNSNDLARLGKSLFAGKGTQADVIDVFNGGDVVAAGGSNAGGIAGLAVHLDLRYSEDILKETGHAAAKPATAGDTAIPGAADRSAFVAVNSASVKAGRDNAGGVIGNGYQCILQDVFNTADASLDTAKKNNDFRILAAKDNAGGIIGRADGLMLFYSDTVRQNIKRERDYVYSNVANVQAGGNNAGGIAGYAVNGIGILDVYNMGSVKAGRNNAGGLVGYLYQNRTTNRDGQPSKISVTDKGDPLSEISPNENRTLIRSNDKTLDEDGKKPYRGEDFITYDKSVSYISYTTIVTGKGDSYQMVDASGKSIATNRYSSMAKPAVEKNTDNNGKYHISTSGSNAGGIVGYAQAPKPSDEKLEADGKQMKKDTAILRVENVFHAGRPGKPEIGGVWAKGGNAGGIIGNAEYAHLTYSFDVNPGPDGLDVGGTGSPDSKGDHSVMTEAFNDPRVIKDPYAIDDVGLHMIANSANVWASDTDPKDGDGGLKSVELNTGEFLRGPKNAGGAIGYMKGGRAERLYSLKGSVMAPSNLGGIVGHATDHALIRQASRMGVRKEAEDDADDAADSDADMDLDGSHILAGTEGTKRRGSIRVGGIVGYAEDGTQVMDVRNMARVEGRAYVGGIIGQTGDNVKITLAHNMEAVIGKVNSPEDYKDLITVDQMNQPYLDRSAVDGCYIGGIVGMAGTGGDEEYRTGTEIKMVKNDPLLTHNFEEHYTKEVNGRKKDVGGGNTSNQVDGRMYVGGITGSRGIINYAVNTGQVSGVQYIGGLSGVGYRITNSYNTANVEAENNYLYMGGYTPVFSQAVFVGGIAGQLGSRNAGKLQTVDEGSYIKNCYNSSSRVNGASIVGGITGYAIAPVDRTYNSAMVSSEQYNRGNSGSEPIEVGNKIGGIVGQIAQDRDLRIQISDSYNSGAVGGTGDAGGILGFIEYYADGEIVGTARATRVKNSYFIKDSSVRYYDALSSQITTDINSTLRALRLEAGFPIEHFVEKTATASNLKTETVQDSDFGARNYSNMIYNGYSEYRNAIIGTVGGTADAGLSGTSDLQDPLNAGATLDWQTSDTPVLQESGADMAGLSAAKFVFPYNSDGAGSTGDKILIGRDYEFLHLDFSGTDPGNGDKPPSIQLAPDETELENSNQYFASVDNTELSTLYNVWPTKVIDYMKVDVAYDDGGSAEDTEYRDNGTVEVNGRQKAILAGRANAIGMPLWKVNYNYAATGGTGGLVRGVPTSVYTPEILTLTGRFSEHGDKVPRIMKFNIFDGYSRGEYSHDNQHFTVKLIENQIQKSYVMVREDEWDLNKATSSDATPVDNKVVEYQNPDGSIVKYYFYVENQGALDNTEGIRAQDILNLIDVELRRVQKADGTFEIQWTIRLPSVEMDTYMAAKSGFFTAEAVKVYDNADGIVRDDFTAGERTSRMFNMHFANYYSSKDALSYPAGRDPNHNRSIFEEYPDMDVDDFPDGNVTRQYAVSETAALGSVKLEADAGRYAEKVRNRLQIANERHLYNLNKNQNQGTEEIDSYLPYITKAVQLIRDIELSTDPDSEFGMYNCFVIGLSKGSFKRMTGSIDGRGEDGKNHTIGNLRVDRTKSLGLPSDLGAEDYGLIYDLSGGVVKNLRIGADSRIVARRTGVLAFQASNGKTMDNEINNPWYENLGPELPMEEGADAKIYDTGVYAHIDAREAGGFVYETVRRFESSDDTRNTAVRDALTITNSWFGGSINEINEISNGIDKLRSRYATGSLVASGFLCRMQGGFDDNNILDSEAGGHYPLNAFINGSQVTEDAYIYAREYASGIVGAVDNLMGEPQIASVRKSANNGTVVASERASGISQGIMDNGGTELDRSGVYVYSSYNNGIVQTPEETGLASGIGNVIRLASHSVNNGTVIGRIASGISCYGSGDMIIEQCSNNGYVEGNKIAGGIVAVPARWSGGRAAPYREEQLSLNLENCYNTGTVVVTTNEDGNTDVIDNSYAGGIIGLALLYDTDVNWFGTENYLSEIGEDDRKTVLRNCYNAGRVYYKEGNAFSLNHRYIGGIAGGGMHRFVDIQNCYSLSDAEALPDASVIRYRANVNLMNYHGNRLNNWKTRIAMAEPADDRAYNYNLTAVGDMPYGTNVTTLPFADMLNLENFTGFNGDGETVWIIDHTTADENGYVYPFPQFAAEAGPQYVGDDHQVTGVFPDAVFNVNINLEKFGMNVPQTAREIDISQVADKRFIPVQVSYHETPGEENPGDFDNMEGDVPGSGRVPVVTQSRYTFTLDSPSADYELYVYDGDADAADYTPAMIRRYEVKNGNVTSGGKLHDERAMQYFNTSPGGEDYAQATDNALTIGDKEEVGWYMPIRGYYTVVAAARGPVANVARPADYNQRIADLAENSPTRGGIRAEDTANSSKRFQVHFSGNSIEERGGAYRSGSRDKPYEVVDQYGIIGMTTSGIAQKSTDRRYYSQVKDIVVREHAYPMFEFNGVYDGRRKDYSPAPGTKEPFMKANYTLSYRTGQGDFGFINYLVPTNEALGDGFTPAVSNLNVYAEADGRYSRELGRYLEASGYYTALGLVADYAEYAKLEQVTVLGDVVYRGTDHRARGKGFFGNYTTALGGVAGIAKNTVIDHVQNKATLGVAITKQETDADGLKVAWTDHAAPGTGVTIAGIAAGAMNKPGAVRAGEIKNVSNNGELRAAAHGDAAGLVHTSRGVEIRYAVNGGWIRAMNGTAAGLVHATDSRLEYGYNSGLVTAGSVKGQAAGTAVGLFNSVSNNNNIKKLYNAGIVRGHRQGAITRGSNTEDLKGKAYYLKDEKLYWMDPSSLPKDMEIKWRDGDKGLEMYLGFAFVPVEVYGFTEDEAAVKGGRDPYIAGDPFALTYAELTSKEEMQRKGFDDGDWEIQTSVKGPVADGTFYRKYGNDEYPLPQLKKFPHLTRRNLNFPVFLGGSKEVAKVPYEGEEKMARYVPLNTPDGGRDETFKDTISVDLNDFSTTAKYRILVYEGNPAMSSSGADKEIVYDRDRPPRLEITVQRRYVDTRDMTLDTSVGGSQTLTPAVVGNGLNKQYSNLLSNDRMAYFYEVNVLDKAKGEERPAVFEKKEFWDENRVNLLFNNDLLDSLEEPGFNRDSTPDQKYYTVTVIEEQTPVKGENTEWNEYYSKFSPHFANAVSKQADNWEFGESEGKPYEIATQRNLYNIAKGTDVTAYLGNHYRQTQDIRLSEKKTGAPIANGSPGAIGVSQAGTTARPIKDLATVMKAQEKRPKLWTESIGAVKNGVTESGFRGTYTARTGTAGTSPDAVTGGHKLIDTRTTIESSVFGRVAPQAKITDVSYELKPTIVNPETEVGAITVNPKVHALLVEENQGAVENILFANNKADGTVKTVSLSRDADKTGSDVFALVVGETFQKVSATDAVNAPAVHRVAVKDGYRVVQASGGATAAPLVLGTVVGRTKGGVDLEQLESAAHISLNASRTSAPETVIGMVVGEMDKGMDGSGPVKLSKSAMTGTLEFHASGNRVAGGIVGRIRDSEATLSDVKAGALNAAGKTDTQIDMKSAVTDVTSGSITGGIVGTVQGGRLDLDHAGSTLSITTEGKARNVVGGMIGSVGKSPGVDAAARVTIASASNAEVSIRDTGSGPAILGGVIGQVAEGSSAGIEGVSAGKTGASADEYAILMDTEKTVSRPKELKVAGGIIGKVEGPDSVVEMTDVLNRLPILAKDNKGHSGYYLGGLIGYSDRGILYLHDTIPGEETNLVNHGDIKVINRNMEANDIYAAGGIGYLSDSPAQMAAFRNTGDVTVTTAETEGALEEAGYSRSHVKLAGAIAYADGGLKGVEEDTAAGSLQVSKSLTVRESLNTGAIRDERKMDDVSKYLGSSVAAGLIAELEGAADEIDMDDPVQIKFNHNAGAIRGIRAAGILTDISESWKTAIKKSDDDSTIMESPLELKYNINISPIDAGYEEESGIGTVEDPGDSEEVEGISHRITGSDITLVYELPLAKVSADGEERELDGYELAELMEEIKNATPSNATPSDATPSDATPSDATPSDATPEVTFYNAALEDMVKAPDYETDPTPPETYADRMSGALLYLAQMQSYDKFRAATRWETHVIGEYPSPTLLPPKWSLEDGNGPGITENRYIPPGGFSRLARAPALTEIRVVPVETLISTWRLELIKAPLSEDDEEEPMEPDSEDMDLINDLDKPLGTASPSNATPSNATSSNATPSNAAGDTFQVVETTTTREMDSYELTWEYSGELMDLVASASNAVDADSREHEFVIVWEYGGRTICLTETGILTEEDGLYHFTVTPEMVAEVTENLPPDESEFKVGISIAALFEGRMYRGDPTVTTVRIPQDSQDESGNAPENMPDINMADYSEALSYLVSYGLSRQGDPYSQALAGQDDYVDCSYFVMDSYRQLGISLPRTAASQARYLEGRQLLVPKGELIPGDLIYYSFQKNGRYKDVSHVAMYVGDGMMVDASSSRGEVVYRRVVGLDSVVLCARPLALAGSSSYAP